MSVPDAAKKLLLLMNFNDFYRDIGDYPVDKIAFVGLGNPLRGDDGAGLFLFDQLRGKKELKNAHFIKAGTNPENYLQKILDLKARLVIFIDAASNSEKAGTISWLSKNRIDSATISTHAFSIRMIEDYLKSEDPALNCRYLVLEPENLNLAENLSQTVLNGIYSFINPGRN
jgi:hydrogenase 3 maturation protease